MHVAPRISKAASRWRCWLRMMALSCISDQQISDQEKMWAPWHYPCQNTRKTPEYQVWVLKKKWEKFWWVGGRALWWDLTLLSFSERIWLFPRFSWRAATLVLMRMAMRRMAMLMMRVIAMKRSTIQLQLQLQSARNPPKQIFFKIFGTRDTLRDRLTDAQFRAQWQWPKATKPFFVQLVSQFFRCLLHVVGMTSSWSKGELREKYDGMKGRYLI